MMLAVSQSNISMPNWHNPLLLSILFLASFGLIMVASSSMDVAALNYNDPWFFARRQAVFLFFGLCAGAFICSLPLSVWHRFSGIFLALSFLLLILVLFPGVGKVVNGSRRWLSLGPLNIQASELAKFCLIVFYASYLTRRATMVTHLWLSFTIMVAIVVGTGLLLLLEPDFGACVIICFALGMMMFVAGVPVIRFTLLIMLGLFAASMVVLLSDYRMDRLLAFKDPFADPYDGGYQLVQSLLAFGRGDWGGLGLGNSIQKLFFLPDAHTDFIFAVIAEEFGLIGAIAVVIGFVFFISQIFHVSIQALILGQKDHSKLFGAYLALGVASMLSVQAFVNMGVASGLLPTKGLTLPFIRYGGSSLMVTCMLLALVLRVQMENANEK